MNIIAKKYLVGYMHIGLFSPGCIATLSVYLFKKNWCVIKRLLSTDNCVISEIPEELLEIFSDDGKPGSKRPKDKVCISLLAYKEFLNGSAIRYHLNFRGLLTRSIKISRFLMVRAIFDQCLFLTFIRYFFSHKIILVLTSRSEKN